MEPPGMADHAALVNRAYIPDLYIAEHKLPGNGIAGSAAAEFRIPDSQARPVIKIIIKTCIKNRPPGNLFIIAI